MNVISFPFSSQIIDPFVEVEIIGLPVDCCKEQTRVVDDNGNFFIFFVQHLLTPTNAKYKKLHLEYT